MNDFVFAENVSKSYKNRSALKNASFSVPKGSVVGLIGPNGAGKTTIIRLLNGVVSANEGAMRVAGLDLKENGDSVRKISGVVTETAGLYDELSGYENLLYFARIYEIKTPNARIQELLARFGLSDWQKDKAGSYSTGMRKRLSLARSLLHRPEILYLDEPTNGLDPEGIRMMMEHLKELNESEGTTIVLCSHVLPQLETLCERYIFIQEGRIVEEGSRNELAEKYIEEIELEAETDLPPSEDASLGYPFERTRVGALRVKLPSRNEAPGFIRALSQKASVYSVRTLNDDLETLYFQIRKAASDS